MEKKIFSQILLFLVSMVILTLIILTYFNKSNEEKSSLSKKKNIEKESLIKTEDKDSVNLISDLKYSSKDIDGNVYEIKALIGEINPNDPDEIFMTDVVAKIQLLDSEIILIKSKFAKYNIKNFETNFSESVYLKYSDHELTSKNIDISFEDNLASISNNIIYKNLGLLVNADKLELDLISKNMKIFMFNKSDKIKIVSK